MNNEQLAMPARNHPYRPTAVRSLFTAHSSLAEIYSFSAKERDVETGLSVTSLRSVSSSSLNQTRTSSVWYSLVRRFGARYYSGDLSIWLAVDPMSDKYPSLSPYVYCADNPVKVVDPNGDSVRINGNKWKFAFQQLQSSTKLNLHRDSKTGTISYSGKAESEADALLIQAIDDTEVNVNLESKDINNINGIPFNGGAHIGTKIEENGIVTSNQLVNPYMLAGIDFWGNLEMKPIPGITTVYSPIKSSAVKSILHEVIEAYKAGVITSNTKIEIQKAIAGNSTYSLYLKAHYQAPQHPMSDLVTPESISTFANVIRQIRKFK